MGCAIPHTKITQPNQVQSASKRALQQAQASIQQARDNAAVSSIAGIAWGDTGGGLGLPGDAVPLSPEQQLEAALHAHEQQLAILKEEFKEEASAATK